MFVSTSPATCRDYWEMSACNQAPSSTETWQDRPYGLLINSLHVLQKSDCAGEGWCLPSRWEVYSSSSCWNPCNVGILIYQQPNSQHEQHVPNYLPHVATCPTSHVFSVSRRKRLNSTSSSSSRGTKWFPEILSNSERAGPKNRPVEPREVK